MEWRLILPLLIVFATSVFASWIFIVFLKNYYKLLEVKRKMYYMATSSKAVRTYSALSPFALMLVVIYGFWLYCL